MNWQPIETAPPDGFFLVTDGRRQMVAAGKMLAASRAPGVPYHLGGTHWTYWMALPPLPAAREAQADDSVSLVSDGEEPKRRLERLAMSPSNRGRDQIRQRLKEDLVKPPSPQAHALKGIAHEMRGMATASAMAGNTVLADVIKRWADLCETVAGGL
jgi:hypothetical protein